MLNYLVTDAFSHLEPMVQEVYLPHRFILQKCTISNLFHTLIREDELWILLSDDYLRICDMIRVETLAKPLAVYSSDRKETYVLLENTERYLVQGGEYQLYPTKIELTPDSSSDLPSFFVDYTQERYLLYEEDPTLLRFEPESEVLSMDQCCQGTLTFLLTIRGEFWYLEKERVGWKQFSTPESIIDYQYYCDTQIWVGKSGRIYAISLQEQRLIEVPVHSRVRYEEVQALYAEVEQSYR